MKHRYQITPEGRGQEPSDAELLRYRNHAKLVYNYQRARTAMHRKPLYKDPKAFVVLLVIVALAWFISEVVDKPAPATPPTPEARP